MTTVSEAYVTDLLTTSESLMEMTTNGNFLHNESLNNSLVMNTEPPVTSQKHGGVLSTPTQEILNLIDFIILQAIVLFPGIIANMVNIYTFVQIGLTDTVTISFFALAMSDMACLLIAVYNWLCYILYRIPRHWDVDMFALMYLGVWYFQTVYDVSMLITTYTAVQKCCCVALPLKFRRVFTRKRTVVVIVLIWTICIACYAPLLAAQGLTKKTVNGTSKYIIWFAHYREDALAANDIIIRIVLQNASEVIVIACLVILIRSLQIQTKFRHSNSNQTIKRLTNSTESFSDLRPVSSTPSINSSIDSVSTITRSIKSRDDNGSTRISSKEVQVIKSVTLVSIIFVTATFPRIVLSIARIIVPEMDTFKRYHNLHLTLQMLRRLIEVSGASANFLIYYNFNNKFRQSVRDTFSCCRK